jgi:hypothetical protein
MLAEGMLLDDDLQSTSNGYASLGYEKGTILCWIEGGILIQILAL